MEGRNGLSPWPTVWNPGHDQGWYKSIIAVLEMHFKVKGVTCAIACIFKLLRYKEPGLDGPDTEIKKNFD